MPWLISSTTRNDTLDSDCIAIKYMIVDTERSYEDRGQEIVRIHQLDADLL